MTEKIKNEDGFSLLEIIISIGMMSILSVFILQMFMSGARVNLRAKNMDIASNIAASVLEELGSAMEPNEFMDTDFIADTWVAFGLSAFFRMDDRQAFSSFDFGSGFRLYKYYDENWQPINFEGAEEELAASEDERGTPDDENVAFILRLYMTPYTGEGELINSDIDLTGLFNVEVDVRDLNRIGTQERLLVALQTKVYFSAPGEMYGIY